MGFDSLIKSQVQGAMRILGQDDGLAPLHDYVVTVESVYDPATGTVADTQTFFEDVPMVLARFRIDEMDNQIVPQTDMKVLIAALDLGAEPSVQDLIYLKNGLTYMVERIMGVPGSSLHILHVRQTMRV